MEAGNSREASRGGQSGAVQREIQCREDVDEGEISAQAGPTSPTWPRDPVPSVHQRKPERKEKFERCPGPTWPRSAVHSVHQKKPEGEEKFECVRGDDRS